MDPIGSAYNRKVCQELNFPAEVYLVDSTIRSLQSGVSGSTHSLEDLTAVGLAVDSLGVREQIINVSWRDGLEVIANLRAAGVKSRLVATFRARNERAAEWTQAAAEAGADEVSFESARDPQHLGELADLAATHCVDFSHGFAEEYTTDEVVAIIRAGIEFGCRSQSFHDSFFHLAIGPEAIRAFIGEVRQAVPDHPPLYVHLSNFFGHATMTAIAALSAGATAADVCLNGTGHHCGHTALGEVALGLRGLYGVDCGIKTERLAAAARAVEQCTSVPRRLDGPVIGEFAFMGDGAYWAAEAHLPFEDRMHATFPVAPEVVGAEEKVVWSDRTATVEAVRVRMSQAGYLDASDEQCAQLVHRIRVAIEDRGGYPGWLEDAEVGRFIDELIGSDRVG